MIINKRLISECDSCVIRLKLCLMVSGVIRVTSFRLCPIIIFHFRGSNG